MPPDLALTYPKELLLADVILPEKSYKTLSGMPYCENLALLNVRGIDDQDLKLLCCTKTLPSLTHVHINSYTKNTEDDAKNFFHCQCITPCIVTKLVWIDELMEW